MGWSGMGGLVLAYLLGSTPTAWVVGRALKGIDLRQHGSGNLGATNVHRTLGPGAALVVLLIDAAKGAVPPLAFPTLLGTAGAWWPLGFGTAAIAGHVVPYFGLFKGGGKGVATTSGMFSALAPVPFAIALTAFLLVVSATRYVSLGSLIGAATLALACALTRGIGDRLTLLAAGAVLFVGWTHRANIGRLRRGEEARLGRPSMAP